MLNSKQQSIVFIYRIAFEKLLQVIIIFFIFSEVSPLFHCHFGVLCFPLKKLDWPVTICMGKAVYLAVAGDVFDGVFLCCPFSHEMSWMRYGT